MTAKTVVRARIDERVGNWQCLPAWFYFKPEYQRIPLLDVYATAKVLWHLASGKDLLPSEHWSEPEFDLTVAFAGRLDRQGPDYRLWPATFQGTERCQGDCRRVGNRSQDPLPWRIAAHFG